MSHEWTFELKRGRLEGRAFLDVVAFSISNQGDIQLSKSSRALNGGAYFSDVSG